MKTIDLLSEKLMGEIDNAFKNYENYALSDNEWGCNSYLQRLIGILVALQSISGEDTEQVMLLIMECTDAKYLPFAFDRIYQGKSLRKGYPN